MAANFTLTKTTGREYTLDIPGPGKGDIVVTVRELSRETTPPVFNELEVLEIPLHDIPYNEPYTFPSDNVYQVESETSPPDANDTIYNVIIAEDVESAMLCSIKQILCSCGCEEEWKQGKRATALYYFNSLSLNYYTYLSIVNEQNADEYIFDQLDSDQLAELATIQLVIDRVKKIKECVEGLKDLCKCS